MKKNVGKTDRIMRFLGALLAASCAVMAPLPLAVRGPLFGSVAGYLLFTAVVGTCVGYRLMGQSTCELEPKA